MEFMLSSAGKEPFPHSPLLLFHRVFLQIKPLEFQSLSQISHIRAKPNPAPQIFPTEFKELGKAWNMKCSRGVLLGLEFFSEPSLGHWECSGIKGIPWDTGNALGLKECSRTLGRKVGNAQIPSTDPKNHCWKTWDQIHGFGSNCGS